VRPGAWREAHQPAAHNRRRDDTRSQESGRLVGACRLGGAGGARLRFRHRHGKAAVSSTTIGWEAIDHPTEVSGPAGRDRRYADAVAMIDVRATDPSGVANAIVVACREVQAEGGSVRADAAVRLMVTRLAWVCGATEPEDYPQLVAVCRLRAVGW
jgi:hypothetical protein